jgi:hypothetical protein
MIKKALIALGAILIVIQFIKPEKNISAIAIQPNAIATKYTVPDSVSQILKVACYDCHSNNTTYPWYNNIQPVAWYLNDHIKEGKSKFNFDEFITYSLKRQDHKLEELIESQKDSWMPLDSYTWIHKDADLTDLQRNTLINWANNTRKQIQSNPEFASSPKK